MLYDTLELTRLVMEQCTVFTLWLVDLPLKFFNYATIFKSIVSIMSLLERGDGTVGLAMTKMLARVGPKQNTKHHGIMLGAVRSLSANAFISS